MWTLKQVKQRNVMWILSKVHQKYIKLWQYLQHLEWFYSLFNPRRPFSRLKMPPRPQFDQPQRTYLALEQNRGDANGKKSDLEKLTCTTSKWMAQKYLPIRQNVPIRQGSESTSKFYNLRKFLGGLNALCTFKKLGEGKTFFILCVLLNNISVICWWDPEYVS